MKILNKLALGLIFLSSIAQASWWGDLRGGDRAAIIVGSALILNNSYQNSEMKHRNNLKNLDTQIRRDYDTQRTIEEAHRKYSNKKINPIENQVYTQVHNNEIQRNNFIYDSYTEVRNPIKEYIDNPSLGRVLYSDDKTSMIELYNGTRFMVETRYLNKNHFNR